MNAELLALAPDRLFRRGNTAALLAWLHARGTTLTLLELEAERRRRGLDRRTRARGAPVRRERRASR